MTNLEVERDLAAALAEVRDADRALDLANAEYLTAATRRDFAIERSRRTVATAEGILRRIRIELNPQRGL